MPWSRDYFPPTKPISTEGGIKARSKRGAFASNWWGQRWLQVLEALNLGGRMQRARNYARRGQVVAIDIAPGAITAAVQGSRPKPYRVRIGVKEVGGEATRRLRSELEKTPYFLAKLLMREMPQDIETLFTAARIDLFPSRASELHTDCSCPDWSNPCKHIGAVHYLIGEEFDRDPFLILRLRGIDTAALLEGLAAGSSEDIEASTDGQADLAETVLMAGAPPPESFWEGSRAELDLTAANEPLREPAVLLRSLGNLPFWRGEQPLAEALAPSYAAASSAAMERLAGIAGR
jgi:uncharacterized Zn finger protein